MTSRALFSTLCCLALSLTVFNQTLPAKTKKPIPFELKQNDSNPKISTKKLIEETEGFILKKTNEARGAKKIGSVRPEKILIKVAKSYSSKMLKENFISHTSPEGTTVLDRIRAVRKNYDESCGENLHMIQSEKGLHDPQAIASQMMKDWLNSPSHRKNLLSKEYELLGVGCASDGERIYCTQVFSGPEI